MSAEAPADDGVTTPQPTSGPPAVAAPPPGSTVMPLDPEASSALPAGYRLHEFTLERLIGEGGFGIVYLARDDQLQRPVAIKEYMPAQLAYRLPDHTVSARSRRHVETFALGLRSFVNEARLLASFDHPSLVKVYRFWEDNGTAYMVMPYYQGPTLKTWLLDHEEPPDERWLKTLLRPLLDALATIHASHCYHRDISPDNILLLSEHEPLLLDFGAARRVIGDSTQTLTVFLKPGYAPIEQYAEVPSMKQGAWTDVYALCAVMYAAIMGYSPIPSVARMIKDELEPVAQAAAGRYSDAFLRAIDAGLAVNPSDRPQDIAGLRALFFPELFALTEPAALDDPDAAGTPSRTSPRTSSVARAAVALAQDDVTVLRETVPVRPRTPASPPAVPAPPPARAGTHRRLWAAGLGGGGLVLAGALAWWLAAGPEVRTTPPPGKDTATAGSAGQAAGDVPAPAASAPAAPREPFSIVGALEQIVRQADPLFAVNTLPDKSPIVVGRDRLQFRVKSNQSGYLYVYLAGTDAAHFWLLFPNQVDSNNRLQADRETVLPRAGWHITAGGPPGVNHIVTVVTPYPMDLGPLGLRQEGDIQEFDLAAAAQRWALHAGPGSPFLGPLQCPDATTPCEQRYGAALVRIEEVNPPGSRN
jgi:serine/threonine protein kinase